MQAGTVRLLFFLLFTINILEAQSLQKHSDGPATGSLQITATVVPSVWLVMDHDGKQATVVANAPDPKESFFHPAAAQKQKTLKATSGKSPASTSRQQTSADMRRALRPLNQSDAAIQFSLPPTKQFEVKQEIILMDVDMNGKTERRPVTVTMVVPQ
jgi:hypothetical protein